MGRLTGLGNTDIPNALGCTFDKEIYTIVTKLSNNHTGTAKLRDEFEVSKNSKFDGNLRQKLVLAAKEPEASVGNAYIWPIQLTVATVSHRRLRNRWNDIVKFGAGLLGSMATTLLV